MAMQRIATRRILPGIAAGILGCVLLFLPAASRAEVTELRIGVQFGVGYLPVYVAQAAGLIDARMKETGLAPVPVTIQNVAGAPQIPDALFSQTMQIACARTTPPTQPL